MLVAVLCIAVKFNAIWYITLLCNVIHQSEVHFVKQCCVLCKVVQCTAVDGGSKVKSIPSLYSRRVVQLIQQKSGNVGQQSVTGRGLSSILKVFHPLRHNQPCLRDPKIYFSFEISQNHKFRTWTVHWIVSPCRYPIFTAWAISYNFRKQHPLRSSTTTPNSPTSGLTNTS